MLMSAKFERSGAQFYDFSSLDILSYPFSKFNVSNSNTTGFLLSPRAFQSPEKS